MNANQMKLFRISLAALALVLVPQLGFCGFCTAVSITANSSATVLAANDLGTMAGGRHFLQLQVVTTPTLAAIQHVYCNIGGTAAINAGIQLNTGYLGSATLPSIAPPMYQFYGVQLPAKTFPMFANGVVSCFNPTGNNTQIVSACDY